jgi:hypothetical protein
VTVAVSIVTASGRVCQTCTFWTTRPSAPSSGKRGSSEMSSCTMPFCASDSNAGLMSGSVVLPLSVSPSAPRTSTRTVKYEYSVSCARPS